MGYRMTCYRGYSSAAGGSSEALVSPLEGVKILDLTRILAGPFATMIMSDLGAEVVKVMSCHIMIIS